MKLFHLLSLLTVTCPSQSCGAHTPFCLLRAHRASSRSRAFHAPALPLSPQRQCAATLPLRGLDTDRPPFSTPCAAISAQHMSFRATHMLPLTPLDRFRPIAQPRPYPVAAPFAPLPPPPTFLHRANPCPSSPRPNHNSDECPPHRSGGNGQQHARESTRSTQAEAVLGRIQGQVRRDGSDPPKNQIRPDTVHFWVSSPCARNLTVALATRQVGGLRLGVQGPRLCRKHL